jgi:hypothetical protein
MGFTGKMGETSIIKEGKFAVLFNPPAKQGRICHGSQRRNRGWTEQEDIRYTICDSLHLLFDCISSITPSQGVDCQNIDRLLLPRIANKGGLQGSYNCIELKRVLWPTNYLPPSLSLYRFLLSCNLLTKNLWYPEAIGMDWYRRQSWPVSCHHAGFSRS